MDKKKIVLISAAFFPRNSPRANRTTELAKELARVGHDVTVYAVLGKYDYSDFERSFNLKIKSLGKMKHLTFNSDVGIGSKPSFFKSMFLKVSRKLVEYPAIELSFKVARILKHTKNVDLLITVAVPYTVHWGAAFASKYFPQNRIRTWVADCGDPYMGNKLSKRLFYFKYIEKWFCRKVDFLTIPIQGGIDGYYKEFHSKIRIIPQGFSFDDVLISGKTNNNDVITFVYAGVFYKDIRDPRPFLDYLCGLDQEFKFIVFTRTRALLESYRTKLKHKLEIYDYIPRLDLLRFMSQADFLVNFDNNTEVQSPSKLIDYALAKRPILSVNSFHINKEEINQFLVRNYEGQLIINDIEQYNIKNVARKFIELAKC